jgi:N-methylhydantoinase B
VAEQQVVQATVHPLRGYQGGSSGVGNFMVFREGTDSAVVISCAEMQVPVAEGEVVAAQSGGGGGWGDPLERAAESVLADVLDRCVSVEGARHDYGVVIDPTDHTIDREATEAERARLAEARAGNGWLPLGRKRTLSTIGLLPADDEVDLSSAER